MAKYHVVIFVEGETDEVFYTALIDFYKKNYKISTSIQIINLKGIGKYESKLYSKVKNDILSKHENNRVKIICSYDTDVFELAKKPPVNWNSVQEKISSLNINEFYHVKSSKMIEDWFLKDINGICKYLKIKKQKNISGKDGNDKLKKLFKKANKIYQKGNYSHKFISELDIELIRNSIQKEIELLEKAIGLKIIPRKKVQS